MSTSASFSVDDSYRKIRSALASSPADTLPSFEDLGPAALSVRSSLPRTGLGEEATLKHLLDDVVLGFNGSKLSANYYGFVTGGVLPIAEIADNIVTAWDQNVAVHLPTQSVATVVENKALMMLLDFLELGPIWQGRLFTTGATASNVLGLACGREAVLLSRMKPSVHPDDVSKYSVGEMGILAACRLAGVDDIQILTTLGHSSLYKAASIVGIGRQSVKDVGLRDAPWKFDFAKLEERLKKPRTASIVVVSCGEVNTGRFATDGRKELEKIRVLCDRHGAWLHIDGAFGLFSRALPKSPEFSTLRRACEGIELADSITGDAHKCLNVPYDCGFFFTPSPDLLESIFQNPNAAYLSANPAAAIPRKQPSSTSATSPSSTGSNHALLNPSAGLQSSPLNIGLENSRRFRALPVYAVLLAHGRSGLSDMLARQVQLARAVAKFVHEHDGFELLPCSSSSASFDIIEPQVGIIVLFRAKDEAINRDLVERINESRKIYVSGTAWDGKPAARIAVSTWKVDVKRDLALVKKILEASLRERGERGRIYKGL